MNNAYLIKLWLSKPSGPVSSRSLASRPGNKLSATVTWVFLYPYVKNDHEDDPYANHNKHYVLKEGRKQILTA